MAEQMNTQNILQLIRETTPGVYNVNGERLVMVSVKGDFAPEEAWANFRPNGFNEDAWAALERTHQVFQGTIRWDYGQAPIFLQMLCGAPTSDEIATGTRTRIFEIPEDGPRDLDGSTYTVEYGLQSNCERCCYGLLLSITMPTERMGDTIEGQITIICQKATATGVAMTGTAPQSDIFTVELADQDTDHVVNIGGTDITIATTDEASDVQTKVQALGGDWADATVTSA